MPLTPFAPSNAEPAAMDVDAIHTRQKFTRQMLGRCYGCGSKAHARREGNYDCNLCGYCKRVGHWEVVCMDKFLGWARGQNAAATVEENTSEEEENVLYGESSEESDQATVAAMTLATLAELKEQQKVLSEKIAALEADFWSGHTHKPRRCRLVMYMLWRLILTRLQVWTPVTILILVSSLNWRRRVTI